MGPPDPAEGRRMNWTSGKGTQTLNRRVPAGTTVRSRRVERVVLAMALAWIGLANVGRIVLMETPAQIWEQGLDRLALAGVPNMGMARKVA
jgi:hypothetical protein